MPDWACHGSEQTQRWAYAEYIKEHLTAIPNFWEPLTE